MKKMILIACIFLAGKANAQVDTTINKKQDTIRIGNMVIVAGDKESVSEDKQNKNWFVGVKVDAVNSRIDAKNRRLNASKRRRDNGVRVYSSVPSMSDNTLTFKSDTLISINDDTVKVGRIKIVNKREGTEGYGQKNWESLLEGDFKKTNISIERTPKKLKPITTNWWIFDLGFANMIDKTEQLMYQPMYSIYPGYIPAAPVPSSTNLKLNNLKSSNVNIWIVQQKLSLYQHYWNLKYGVGIEMFNFRFEQPISFRNSPDSYVFFDDVHFKKNKLFVEYLTVPVQLNYQSNPQNNKSFYASLGMSAGYLLQSHTKQISDERGKKKVNGNFNLNNLKMSTIGELGIGSIRLYGSYSMTNLFDKNLTNFDMNPFAIGLRFSKF